MVRQCAWCLHLINNSGERLSPSPLPKLYEASHGICGICGVQWMEQVRLTENNTLQENNPCLPVEHESANELYPEVERREVAEQRPPIEAGESITQLVFQLQHPQPGPHVSRLRRFSKVRVL